jgi:hypothetical protein
MRLPRPFLFVGVLLVVGFLMGCSGESPRMKNQPTNPNSGDTRIDLPGKKKSFDAAN